MQGRSASASSPRLTSPPVTGYRVGCVGDAAHSTVAVRSPRALYSRRVSDSPARAGRGESSRGDRFKVEVKRILDRAYDMARKVLTANIHVLHQVAQKLLENESLNNEEFSTLVAQAHAVDVEGLSWAPA